MQKCHIIMHHEREGYIDGERGNLCPEGQRGEQQTAKFNGSL